MKKLIDSIPIFTLVIFIFFKSFASESFYDFKAKDIHGKELDFKTLKNKVVLIVNTATACGFTPQFKNLQEIQELYGPRGFTVIAFPSNDFKQNQESNLDSEKHAKDNYKITFPLMEKITVTGEKKHPLYKFLIESKRGLILSEVQWNFEKFLINREGKVVDRWSSITKPNSKDITHKIEDLLK